MALVQPDLLKLSCTCHNCAMEQLIRHVVAGDLVSLRISNGTSAHSRNSIDLDDDDIESPKCLLPGSFNPLHTGHLAMAKFAGHHTAEPVDYELSIANVDKPSLSVEQVTDRIAQFRKTNVWLTRAATFVQKAKLFPDCCFVVGADTAVRLFDPKYYRDSADVDAAIAHFHRQRCRFLVFGRLLGDRFVDASELAIPAEATELIKFVPETKFRVDISSTEMRRKRRLE